MNVVFTEPLPHPAIAAIEQQEKQAGNHRRNGERDINQCGQQLAPGEPEAGHQPGQEHAEHHI